MKTKTLSILGTLALPLLLGSIAGSAHAEITQDCILEGNVDKRKAAQLGQDVYVKFRSAEASDGVDEASEAEGHRDEELPLITGAKRWRCPTGKRQGVREHGG